MDNACTWTIEDGIGVITIDSPPVNALSGRVRRGLDAGFRSFAADGAVKAVVLICAGRTFCVGADISEIGRPIEGPRLSEVFEIIETGVKPVIAAIHGTALGGGYEFALICHHRIAVPSARVGLPEVNLGLIPGGGGTQRLPRVVGVEAALDLLTSGEHVPAAQALDLGMIDALAEEGRLREDAIVFARRILAGRLPLRRVRDRHEKVAAARGHPEIFDSFLSRNAQAFRGRKAPVNIVRAVEAAAELTSFDDGMKRESELFTEMWQSSEAAACSYLFSAEREAAKIPDVRPDARAMPMKNIALVGSGALSGGIAQSLRRDGLPVAIFEVSGDALPALDLSLLEKADLVIETGVLTSSERRNLFGRLDRTCRPDTLMASGSAFADLDELAAANSHPSRVLGMHFFTAPQGSRLIEVVRGGKTSGEAIATVMKLTKRIGMVAVLCRIGEGLIADRVMRALRGAVDDLLLEGLRREDIDRAIYDFGFPAGPFQMTDSAGSALLDLGGPRRADAGDGGRERKASPDRASPEEIAARVLYPVVNEGARLLEAGIALRASDIDVACVLGCGWPVYTGGPMFWADTLGLPAIVAKLEGLAPKYGARIQPAPLLKKLAGEGRKFTGR
jgi:3-hydroxyacyl-CoA dehydrogenase